MGLLDYLPFTTSSETDKRASEVRTGAVAPSRRERETCYIARDAYFACLDAHGIVDAVKDEREAGRLCRREGGEFEKDCAAQWVTYFKKWRVQDFKKRKQLAELEARGANKMDMQSDLNTAAAASGGKR